MSKVMLEKFRWDVMSVMEEHGKHERDGDIAYELLNLAVDNAFESTVGDKGKIALMIMHTVCECLQDNLKVKGGIDECR